MSCEECEKVQEQGGPVCFVRVQTGNVLIVGCATHVLTLVEAWRLVSKEEVMAFITDLSHQVDNEMEESHLRDSMEE
jgi:hypothetical protein